jgi:hypothetical protein
MQIDRYLCTVSQTVLLKITALCVTHVSTTQLAPALHRFQLPGLVPGSETAPILYIVKDRGVKLVTVKVGATVVSFGDSPNKERTRSIWLWSP